jgi:mono/diheme cytochrome c family protein
MKLHILDPFRFVVVPAVLALLYAAPVTGQAQRAGAPAAASQAQIERGRYLVTVQDCHGCHTPFNEKGEPDMTRMLSGHPATLKLPTPPSLSGGWGMVVSATNTAWSGPWGISYTTNLTPDRATGIGAWSEQNFIDAIRKGRKAGSGRPLLPPMPWPNYAKMTDEDLRAVYAYLMSIPPIRNAVPAAILAPAPR